MSAVPGSASAAQSSARRLALSRGAKSSGGTPARGLLPIIVVLGLWQLIGSAESPYFPVPSEWYAAIKPLAQEGVLAGALGWTSLTFGIGLALATVTGAVLGTLVGSSRTMDRAFGPMLEFVRALPAAAIVPVLALILGYTMQMKLAVVVIPSTWPILLSCRTARRSMSPLLLDVPRTLGLSQAARLRKVLLPSMLPGLLLGVRVAAPLALIVTLLVEIVTRINGLGALLADAQTRYLSAQVYGLLMIAGALGYAVNWIVTRSEVAVARRMRGDTDL
jgi:ABC-type nitrate/sulfonate/bicarbonate transport system permease component